MDLTVTFDYELMEREERPFARRLALWMYYNTPGRVVDLGAGTGVYVEELRAMGIAAQGYDICEPQPNPLLVRTASLLMIRDPAPVVLCLEVGEHIAADLAGAVVESVWRNTLPGGIVIWSAAQPGQGGVGHINCQPPEYWRDLALSQGFGLRQDLRDSCLAWMRQGYHMGWFVNNCQIWQRPR